MTRRHWTQTGVVFAVLASLSAGCNMLVGNADRGLSSHDASKSDDDASKCGNASDCVEAASCECVTVPAGWEPVARPPGPVDGMGTSSASGCPSGFGNPQSFVAGVDAAPYDCDCACSGTQTCFGALSLNTFSDPLCKDSYWSAEIHVQSTCLTNDIFFQYSQSLIGTPTDGGYTLSDIIYDAGPACGAIATATNMPTPSSTTVTLCSSVETSSETVCLNEVGKSVVCLKRSTEGSLDGGDTGCPPCFPSQIQIAQATIDDRSCGECACGSTLTCSPDSLILSNDNTCDTSNYAVVVARNGCSNGEKTGNTSFPINSVQMNSTTPGSGVCANITTPSVPEGGVALDPRTTVTLCCPN